jgi:hypothetical protein
VCGGADSDGIGHPSRMWPMQSLRRPPLPGQSMIPSSISPGPDPGPILARSSRFPGTSRGVTRPPGPAAESPGPRESYPAWHSQSAAAATAADPAWSAKRAGGGGARGSASGRRVPSRQSQSAVACQCGLGRRPQAFKLPRSSESMQSPVTGSHPSPCRAGPAAPSQASLTVRNGGPPSVSP